MRLTKPIALVIALAALPLAAAQSFAQDAVVANDYPTMARADYVFACMQVNGRSRQILEKCSCSIDVIAELLPYEKYEEAETVMSIRQKGGEAVAPLMTPEYQEKILQMKRAQVEGELRCF